METDEYKLHESRLRAYLEKVSRRYAPSRIDDFALLRNYHDVKKLLGRIPIEAEIGKYGRFARNDYRNHFGSYQNFLVIIGEIDGDVVIPQPRVQPRVQPTVRLIDLFREYEALSRSLGRPAGWADIEQHFPDRIEIYRKNFKDLDRVARWLRLV